MKYAALWATALLVLMAVAAAVVMPYAVGLLYAGHLPHLGLVDALRILADVPGAVTVRFSEKDVVRHPLVAEIVSAYDRDAQLARGLPTGEG